MKTKNILLGLLLVALGLIFGLNALGLTDIDVFFDGWWTLFIIVPCTVGLFRERDKTGNLIGLTIGVLLLLVCQDFLSFGTILKLIFPAILVIAGLSIIFKGALGDRAAHQFINAHKNDVGSGEYCSTFSGQKLHFNGEYFRGVKLSAVFGSIDLDLTGAIIDHDVLIDASAVFGGIDIIVPQNYRVKICSNSVFGSVSEEHSHATGEGFPTVYVNGTCVFGGVSIK